MHNLHKNNEFLLMYVRMYTSMISKNTMSIKWCKANRSSIVNTTKTVISAETKKSLINNVLNYLNDIQAYSLTNMIGFVTRCQVTKQCANI